jgi:hypothetical protein
LATAVPRPLIEQGVLAALASVAGVALGLFISSISNSRDQAAVIVPLALAPQLILGSGLIASLPPAGEWMAKVLIGSYWSREAMTSALISKESILKIDPNTGMQIPIVAASLNGSVESLLAQTAGWLVVTIAIMYWRYGSKRE